MRLGKRKIKQVLFSALAVIAALTLVWGYYNFSPLGADLKKLKAESSYLSYEIESLKEAELPQKKNKAQNLLELKNLLEQASLKISLIEKKLPPQKDLGPFFSELTRLSKESSIDFFKISSEEPIKENNFLEIPIEIQIKSDFFTLTDYLEKLEEFDRLVCVKTFEVELEPDEPLLVEANIKASIFMF